MLRPETSLGELAATYPPAAKVFHQHGLDFCCGGKQSLEHACVAKGVDAHAVLREIEAAGLKTDREVRWDRQPLDALIQHILTRYHTPLKTELLRIVAMAAKVDRVHADKPDCPTGLAELMVEVHNAVESHLQKEELILFPLILAGRGNLAHSPVQVMNQEHDDHGANLRRIRELTNDHQPPEYACGTWRELYRSLSELEVELMDHIHLENNILFPRALAS